jgi:shikimate kinase
VRIIIIGFMASGKSTIAKALAHELGFKFLDIDTLIEEHENKTITQIFAENGELYFRNLEREILFSLSNRKFIVVASGGGTPCFEDNMDFINQHFISVYLNADSNLLFHRLRLKKRSRPLVANSENLQQTIGILLSEREKFYKRANVLLDISSNNTKQIVSAILEKL